MPDSFVPSSVPLAIFTTGSSSVWAYTVGINTKESKSRKIKEFFIKAI
jgi:hypothetical protein